MLTGVMDNISDETGKQLERNFVKETYDQIATDFSSTRYKKWPKVEKFIRDLPEQSLMLDVGCGNGKYLDCCPGFSIGCDISQNLLLICRSRGFEVVLCDMTRLPFREDIFDAVICVAALHHVVSSNRRLKCLDKIVKTMTKDSAKLLIQVWSYEQNLEQNNPYLKKIQPETLSQPSEEVQLEGGMKMPIHINRTSFSKQDLLVPFKSKCQTSQDMERKERHLRYYHVFKEKELDGLCEKVDNLIIENSYYDRGNWCIIANRYRDPILGLDKDLE